MINARQIAEQISKGTFEGKVYKGVRDDEGCAVSVIRAGKPSYRLNPRHDLRNHSPSGFEWGFGGSGPAQLALAILCDHLGDVLGIGHGDELAQAHYQGRFGYETDC